MTAQQPPVELTFETPWVPAWRPEFIGTLVFIVQQDQVLLIHKKTGHGAGKVNGPGGKLDPAEQVLACAQRELYEEVGLKADDLVCRAEMRFVELNGPQWLGFAFTGSQVSGQLSETREAAPFWCPLNEIPYTRMWPDDAIWLPLILDAHHQLKQGENQQADVFVADYLFDDGELLEHQVSTDASIWSSINAD